jgi:hypothetical protein
MVPKPHSGPDGYGSIIRHLALPASVADMTGGCVMRVLSLMLFGLCLCGAATAGAQQAKSAGAPETFGATARAENAAGAAVSSPILVHIERYTPDFDLGVVKEALRVGGYPGFVPALKKAPIVGSVELNRRKFTIRWARETPSPTGRTIVVVTDTPMVFIGGEPADAKPKAGYQVGLIQLTVDGRGTGTGIMAGAARVKSGGETGVQIDDYGAEAPIKLTAVTRK